MIKTAQVYPCPNKDCPDHENEHNSLDVQKAQLGEYRIVCNACGEYAWPHRVFKEAIECWNDIHRPLDRRYLMNAEFVVTENNDGQ